MFFNLFILQAFLNAPIAECLLIITANVWSAVMIYMHLATGAFYNIYRTDILKKSSGCILWHPFSYYTPSLKNKSTVPFTNMCLTSIIDKFNPAN